MFYSFLFSFQCPLTRLSRRVPIYITILSPFCKAFSCPFFIFFSLSLFFYLYINVFPIGLFLLFFYVLCKQVIERNFQSISLTKILGFRNSEIGSLYIVSTSIAVVLGLAISVPFIDVAMRAIFKSYLYTMMTGYFPYVMSPITYIVTVATGIICYAVVALLQMRKVSKVSKSEALKNVE